MVYVESSYAAIDPYYPYISICNVLNWCDIIMFFSNFDLFEFSRKFIWQRLQPQIGFVEKHFKDHVFPSRTGKILCSRASL